MLYSSEKNEISMVLSGDAMITRPLAAFDEPQFLALSYIFKKSDVGFTNFALSNQTLILSSSNSMSSLFTINIKMMM